MQEALSVLLGASSLASLNDTSHNASSCSDAPQVALGASLVACYGLVLCVAVGQGLRLLWRDRQALVQLLFSALLAVFLGLRVAWLTLKLVVASCRTVATFVLNRVGFCFYFAALSLILFFWAESANRTILDDPKFSFLPSVRLYFILTNAVVLAYQLTVIIIWLVNGQGREGSLLYDTNILVDEALVFVLALVVAFYGFRLWRTALEGGDESDARLTEGRLFLLSSGVMALLFLGRVWIFLWRFIFVDPLPDPVFYVFGYALPELLPSMLHLHVARYRRRVSAEGADYIQGLYAASTHSDPLSFLLHESDGEKVDGIDSGMPSPIIQADYDPRGLKSLYTEGENDADV